MTAISLVDASRIYACADNASIHRHRVDVPLLSEYSRALKSLRLSLGEEASNDYWREVMWRVFWYRKLMGSAPLPPSHPALLGAELIAHLQRHLRYCDEIAPRVATRTHEMLRAFESVVGLQTNPLLAAIVELHNSKDSEGVAILVAEARLIVPTQEVLDRSPVLEGAEALHLSELRTGRTFRRLFLVGACEWYGRGVLSAPRAPLVDAVRYSFVPDRWKSERAFVGQLIGNRNWEPDDFSVEEDLVDDAFETVEMPVVDVQQLVKRIGGQHGGSGQDVALAKLVLIEGGLGVFLEADRDSKAFVIDLDSDGEDRVVRLPVASLERGMFLLLRTEGGGDYIVPVADRLLGQQATSARASVKLWKTILGARMRDYGPAHVAKELEQRGGKGVDANDVRRWMSPTTIGTTRRENFEAILAYAGLTARGEELWNLMRRLQIAHKQAGQHIRRLLLDEVEKVDLGALRKHGFLEFELPGQDAGSLSAYRIEKIIKDELLVGASKLSRPFHPGSGLWLE